MRGTTISSGSHCCQCDRVPVRIAKSCRLRTPVVCGTESGPLCFSLASGNLGFTNIVARRFVFQSSTRLGSRAYCGNGSGHQNRGGPPPTPLQKLPQPPPPLLSYFRFFPFPPNHRPTPGSPPNRPRTPPSLPFPIFRFQ